MSIALLFLPFAAADALETACAAKPPEYRDPEVAVATPAGRFWTYGCLVQDKARVFPELYRSAVPEDYTQIDLALLVRACLFRHNGCGLWTSSRSHTKDLGWTVGVAWLGRSLDEGRLEAELAEAGVDGRVVRAFVKQVELAKGRMDLALAGMRASWRDHLLEATPRFVQEWREDEAFRAPWREKAEALAERVRALEAQPTGDTKLLGELAQLRHEYVKACVARGRSGMWCAGDPVGAHLNAALLATAALTGEPPTWWAERDLRADLRYRRDSREFLYHALATDIDERHAAVRAANKALGEGVDRALLEAEVGNLNLADLPPRGSDQPGLEEVPSPYRLPVVDLRSTGCTSTSVGRTVDSVKRTGDSLLIHWSVIKIPLTFATGCRDTNRIAEFRLVGSALEPVYEQVCTGPNVSWVAEDRLQDVVVPAYEASWFTVGQYVGVNRCTESNRATVTTVLNKDMAAVGRRGIPLE